MKKKFFVSCFLFLLGGAAIGWIAKSQTFNPRASIPTILEKPLSFSIEEGEDIEGDLLYKEVDLTDFVINGSTRTKIAVVGQVNKILPEPDGDYHVLIDDSRGHYLVTEFIPEIKLSLPTAGEKIKIWGITHFDYPHNWWEIHPVIGWQKI